MQKVQNNVLDITKTLSLGESFTWSCRCFPEVPIKDLNQHSSRALLWFIAAVFVITPNTYCKRWAILNAILRGCTLQKIIHKRLSTDLRDPVCVILFYFLNKNGRHWFNLYEMWTQFTVGITGIFKTYEWSIYYRTAKSSFSLSLMSVSCL